MELQLLMAKADALASGVFMPVVLASGEGVEETGSGAALTTITDSMVSGLSDLSSQLMASIGKILPFVLMVVGGVMVVKFGINLFKKFGSGT